VRTLRLVKLKGTDKSDDRTRRRDNNREHVLIPMRVHADHVIHLVCKAFPLILRLHS
jgi:hypothetical protein